MRPLLVPLAALCGLLLACPPAQTQCGADAPCPQGEDCSASGVCVPQSCACSGTETCLGLSCVTRDCPRTQADGGVEALTCMEGAGCVDGTCETEGCPASCAPDQECALGACRSRNCFNGPACPAGMVCQAGACVTAACANTVCAAGERCVGGVCEPEGCAEVPCRAGEVCRSGSCVASACVGISCPSGEACGNGACYPVDCAGTPCGAGLVCAGGQCVTPSCAAIACPTGQQCANGGCYQTNCTSSSCPLGAVCDQGQCVEARCAGVQCAFGSLCLEGLCESDGDGDGVPDRSDNCPDVANGAQLDLDNDSAGAACDCADGDATRHPGATESCDGVDQDCDGVVDDGLPTVNTYRDSDNDLHGDPAQLRVQCGELGGYVLVGDDCNDGNPSVYPLAPELCDGLDNNCDGATDETAPTWYRDVDGDNHGVPNPNLSGCTRPSGYAPVSDDCDDTLANVFPGNPEVCDGRDNNCSGVIDEGVTITYYRDADGDGFGTVNTTVQACSAPSGYVANSSDCNDTDGAINPNTVWYRDADNDGYGLASTTLQSCTQPAGYVRTSGDCNDGNGNIHPGVLDPCDGVNNDCDGLTDEDPEFSWYADGDLDGYGAGPATATCSNPDPDPLNPPAFVQDNQDCNDGNGAVHPGVSDACGDATDFNCDGLDGEVERCDGADNDCDGATDELFAARTTSINTGVTVSTVAAGSGICAPAAVLSSITPAAFFYQGSGTTTITDRGGASYPVASCLRADLTRGPAWITRVTADLAPAKPNNGPPCASDFGGGSAGQDVKIFAVDSTDALVFIGQRSFAGCANNTCGGLAVVGASFTSAGVFAKAVVVCRSGATADSNNLTVETLTVYNTCTQ